ncbi:hemicentin-1-like, partial [Ruditapes philippinarum]|uniref:hemicentin-1-like n=1 Tax=Ruditapes philippinarum TaxID=129788 RepID=UPI00295BF428
MSLQYPHLYSTVLTVNMNSDDFDDTFTSEDLHTLDQIEQTINTKSEGITSNPDKEKQDYLDLIFEDLHTLDQIEQTINTKSEGITSNPDKEKQDYLDLKTYFLDNAIPSNLSFLATWMGFPRQVYKCIEADHPRRCLDRMHALFDLWYPIAKEIGHKNGLLPVHILSYVKYSYSSALQRAPKLLVSLSTDITVTPKVLDDVEERSVSFKCVHNGTGLRMAWQRKDGIPVKALSIKPNEKSIQISENKTTTFTCNTSYSRPIPEIQWLVKNHSHLQLTGEQTNGTNPKGLTSSESTLIFKPSRTYNGWKLYCFVNKSEVQKESMSSSLITLNVTYPPDLTLMINGSPPNGNYYVIKHSIGTLTCKITGGNPKPSLSWTRCFDNDIYTSSGSSSTTESETNTLTWQAMSDTDRSCTCQSIQIERNDSVSINIKVLYPPSIPILTFGSLNVSGNIYIIQNEQLLLDCSSNSKPPPTYKWEAKHIQVTFNRTLQILETEKMHKGNYTCLVTNTMNATERIQNGSSRSTVEVHVL